LHNPQANLHTLTATLNEWVFVQVAHLHQQDLHSYNILVLFHLLLSRMLLLCNWGRLWTSSPPDNKISPLHGPASNLRLKSHFNMSKKYTPKLIQYDLKRAQSAVTIQSAGTPLMTPSHD
jgi:hypothetical protein